MENLKFDISHCESVNMEKGLRWFLRRIDDLDMLYDIEDVIDFQSGLEKVLHHHEIKEEYEKEYIHNVVYGSTCIFMRSNDELENVSTSGKLIIYQFIRSKFLDLILENYYSVSEDCD